MGTGEQEYTMKKPSSVWMKMRVRLPMAVMVIAGMVGAMPALGQNALGDGRALDRNSRVGSGGRNTTRTNSIQNTARFNNAVVTGNAGGGKAFRGYVGYLASDDFRASLGSNDLYSFRRDSASGTAVAQGIRGTDALRYQFGLVTGQTPPSFLGASEATGASLVRSRSGASGLSQGTALRSTSDYLAERSLRSTVIGYRQEQDGDRFAMTASALTGVMMVPMGKAESTRVGGAGGTEVPTGLPGETVLPGTTPGGATATKQEDAGSKARRGGLTGLEGSRRGLNSPFTMAQQVDRSVAAAKMQTRVAVPSTVLDPFTNALPVEKRGGAVVPGTEGSEGAVAPWMQELNRLSERLKRGGEEKEAERGGDGTTPNTPVRPGSISFEEIRQMVKPELDQIDGDVAKALAAARPVLDRLSPAQPTKNSAYDEHMAAGEKLMGEAKYFDAEDRFLRALAASAGDPMASLGRVHAQLGAGLYLSAAMNLHTLFQNHPEMMSTRYARTIQPSDKRAATIAEQMRQSMKATRTMLGKDAALLLAYLGYQRGDRAMLEEGVMGFAEKVTGTDTADRTLLALMQRVWIDGDPELPVPSPVPAPSVDPSK